MCSVSIDRGLEKAQLITVELRNVAGNLAVMLAFSPNEPVVNIRLQAATVFNTPSPRLLFNGIQLDDLSTLAHYSIVDKSSVHVVPRVEMPLSPVRLKTLAPFRIPEAEPDSHPPAPAKNIVNLASMHSSEVLFHKGNVDSKFDSMKTSDFDLHDNSEVDLVSTSAVAPDLHAEISLLPEEEQPRREIPVNLPGQIADVAMNSSSHPSVAGSDEMTNDTARPIHSGYQTMGAFPHDATATPSRLPTEPFITNISYSENLVLDIVTPRKIT